MAVSRTEFEAEIDNLDLNDLNSIHRLRDLLTDLINHREPIVQADTVAKNGTIYYSTDQSKLVFKDLAGVVKDLY